MSPKLVRPSSSSTKSICRTAKMNKRKLDQVSQPQSSAPKKICPETLPALPTIDPELEKLVFTHPSAATKLGTEVTHYDRLEFIGDAHLELLASNLIYDTYPTASAGRMAQIRQQLVQNETLAQYSIAYKFDKRLKINISQQHIAKTPFTKIYGDVFEAYVGAIFRSDPVNGPAKAEEWVKALWAPRWSQLQIQFPPDLHGMKEELAKKIMVPGVRLDYVGEKPTVVHKGKGIETHYIGVYLSGWGYTNQHLGSGNATTKARAGQEAAKDALDNNRLISELAEKKSQYSANKSKTAEKADHGQV